MEEYNDVMFHVLSDPSHFFTPSFSLPLPVLAPSFDSEIFIHSLTIRHASLLVYHQSSNTAEPKTMSSAPRSPVGSGRATPNSTAEEANGYLLLTIQHATAKQLYQGSEMTLAKGEMR